MQKSKSSLKLIRRFLPYLYPYWKKELGGCVCMMIGTLLSLLMPLITKVVIDNALPKKDTSLLLLLCLAGLALFVLGQVISFIQKYLFFIVSQRVVFDVRLDFYQHVQRLPLKFYSDKQTGEIISRVVNDVSGVQSLLADTFFKLFNDAVTLLLACGILFYLHWKLAIISLIVLPFFVFSFKYFGKRIREISRLNQEKVADMYSTLQEQIAGTELIKAFVKEKYEAIRFIKRVRDVIKMALRRMILGSISGFATGFVGVLGPTAVLFYGGMEVIRGNLTLGSLVAFTAILGYVYGPVKRVFDINISIQIALASVERVVEILDIPKETRMQDAGYNPKSEIRNPKLKYGGFEGCLRFENVHFSYIDSDEVLKGIDLEVDPGMVLGIVGPSGAGKTTLVRLIPRFYDPQEGAIFLDGQNIKDIDLNRLRRNIGIVSQEAFLFSGSLRENICYAKRKVTDRQMIEASKMAQIHDFIMNLPYGYDTQVGERGVKLSGGQKQRIAIARAILADPRILILDEATSFLDSQTEELLQESLKHWLKERTALVIAHRLSTIKDADKIIVLNSGRIVESGTHDELYMANRMYTKLYDRQSVKG